jgi:hypothetical protein
MLKGYFVAADNLKNISGRKTFAQVLGKRSTAKKKLKIICISNQKII